MLYPMEGLGMKIDTDGIRMIPRSAERSDTELILAKMDGERLTDLELDRLAELEELGRALSWETR